MSGLLTLTLHIQPGASRTEYAGPHGDAHKIRLAAAPVEGRANAALIEFLADAFGVRHRLDGPVAQRLTIAFVQKNQ